MKSPTTTIWKTVVLSAALIGGSVGCKGKGEATDPCKDPCKDKKMSPEGGDEYGGDEYGEGEGAWGDDGSGYGDPEDSRGGWDEGGETGRGFVLS